MAVKGKNGEVEPTKKQSREERKDVRQSCLVGHQRVQTFQVKGLPFSILSSPVPSEREGEASPTHSILP